MNVRVDLLEPIRDGMEVVFKAPCDYAEVTGLTLYYPANGMMASQTFAFADAHANDLADLDVLFAKDAVVKVILDTNANMAFVQNADTNAYIEKTFIKTVNGTRPDERGNVVVEGAYNNWTESEKAAMLSDVISALPIYNGEVVAV